MGFYAGIDGGGTKTRCVVGNESSVLATAVSGGCNIVRLGEVKAGQSKARDSIHASVRQACTAAKISPQDLRAICLGAAGAARPDAGVRLHEFLSELNPKMEIEVVGDHVIALEAAFGSAPGVIAISGTGSVVYGRDGSGRIARAGGWGFAVSDEGSGQWIGRHAIAALLRARDEGEETALTALILEAWKLDNIESLVQHANGTPAPEFPRLFPMVVRAADDGDAIARELLEDAGTQLAALAGIVLRRVSPAPPYVPVAMTGSVFRQSAAVRRVFYNHLATSFPGIVLRNEFADPTLGALARARRAGAKLK
jgi:N-acetylglucosamine kinase-like BadF-type ATPase